MHSPLWLPREAGGQPSASAASPPLLGLSTSNAFANGDPTRVTRRHADDLKAELVELATRGHVRPACLRFDFDPFAVDELLHAATLDQGTTSVVGAEVHYDFLLDRDCLWPERTRLAALVRGIGSAVIRGPNL